MYGETKTMKKRTKKQQKEINKIFSIIHYLLEVGRAATKEPRQDRYIMHHSLLDMIDSVKTVLDNNNFEKDNTEKVLESIKEVADSLMPASETGIYQ